MAGVVWYCVVLFGFVGGCLFCVLVVGSSGFVGCSYPYDELGYALVFEGGDDLRAEMCAEHVRLYGSFVFVRVLKQKAFAFVAVSFALAEGAAVFL